MISNAQFSTDYRSFGTYEDDTVPDFYAQINSYTDWKDGGFYMQLDKLDPEKFPLFFV